MIYKRLKTAQLLNYISAKSNYVISYTDTDSKTPYTPVRMVLEFEKMTSLPSSPSCLKLSGKGGDIFFNNIIYIGIRKEPYGDIIKLCCNRNLDDSERYTYYLWVKYFN